MAGEPVVERVRVGSAELHTVHWGGPPKVVLLHDGLGSVGQWGEVPAALADVLGVGVVAYDRPGHGTSTPVPMGAWPTNWLFEQSQLLEDLVAHFAIDAPAVVGHSDGGTIALMHAMSNGTPSCVVAIASHSFVEDETVAGCRRMRDSAEIVIGGLARSHAEPAALLAAWSGVWLSDAFRSLDIRPELSAIEVPVLIAQGVDDEYATEAQALTTVEAIGDNATLLLAPGARHLWHHDDPDTVVEFTAGFIAEHCFG